MIHSEIPNFDDEFEHFEWYLANDVSYYGFVAGYPCRLWTLRIQSMYPKGNILEVCYHLI